MCRARWAGAAVEAVCEADILTTVGGIQVGCINDAQLVPPQSHAGDGQQEFESRAGSGLIVLVVGDERAATV